jgi:uncharacterized protein YydD (DUF2326 family)
MKLSQMYSNYPEIFNDLKFSPGVNYILGEIKDPKNMDKDTHNLGKSTFGKLLDFCLLEERRKNNIFIANSIFENFIFYLEIKLCSGDYITICRSIKNASNVSFVKSNISYKYDIKDKENWLHYNLTFNRAKSYLESELDFTIQKMYSYRKGLGYFLRNNSEYIDLFKIVPQSKNIQWIPYVMHLLGFDENLYLEKVSLEKEKNNLEIKQNDLDKQITFSIMDLNSKLSLKKKSLEIKKQELAKLNFCDTDLERIRESSEDYDIKISDLNNTLYESKAYLELIYKSLNKTILKFDLEEVEDVYKEIGILFPGQLKKDFNQVVEFNKAITEERTLSLKKEKIDLISKCKIIEDQLWELNKKRSDALAFITNFDFVDKYKEINSIIFKLENEISELNVKKVLYTEKKEIDNEVNLNQIELNKIENKLTDDSSNYPERLDKIQQNFHDIIFRVLNRSAYISVSLNKNYTFEFSEKIEQLEELTTSENEGFTYKKLLCAAFDLALLKAYSDTNFYEFVYHDGLFEGLDDRKKINLQKIIREYADEGVQQIITLIDSDLPTTVCKGDFLGEDEILLKLNDLGVSGLLFKMKIW